jgi:hypothetical protein
MHRDQAAYQAAATLNARCGCLSVEVAALRAAVERRLDIAGLPANLAASHPHLFAHAPVFACAADARRMAATVRAVEAAVALRAYREAVLAWAPEIARYDSGARGAFLGFDFHLSDTGPKLIEINTNAGGGLLAATLGEAALSCCGYAIAAPGSAGSFEQRAVEMLIAEWQAAGRPGQPRTVAIVDANPAQQYLHPEFLLMRAALERRGISAVIAGPEAMEIRQGGLATQDLRVDLVYNRLTDFALEGPDLRPLREAYLGGRVVVTPNPRAHALYADKRALALLGDAAWLREAGLDPAAAELLGEVVPPTFKVEAAEGERLWRDRRGLFFKPVAGYGSRGAYRGDKLTRRVFDEILHSEYVAQAIVAPPERRPGDAGSPLKFDLRNYAYAGKVQLLAARLWQGQTTNFRSTGGGFAPVLTLP